MYHIVELKASMEDQMGEFLGGWSLSREFPQGGRSLGVSISSSKFDFPTLSTDVIDNNPK